MKTGLIFAAWALAAALPASADSYRYECICPKPSCGVYAFKKVVLLFDDQRAGEIEFRYLDGPANDETSQVNLLGKRSSREETDSASYFRELVSVDAKTREKRTTKTYDPNAPLGSYLKVEKNLLQGEDRGRVQWVGEKDQGSFALMYYCSPLQQD